MQNEQTQKANKKLLLILVGITFGMGVFAFAMVPLYDVFCEVFGINGKVVSQQQVTTTTAQKERIVTVEFIGQIGQGVNMDFAPIKAKFDVHPGQQQVVTFRARNKARHDVVGQAIYSVSPGQAALYINKTECFCFRQQPLKAGAAAELGLVFFVDHDLPAHIHTLTMQYTMYDITDKVQNTAAVAAK